LEERFGISLPMDNLEIDDLRTVRRMADLILRVSDESIGRVAQGR
jgi:acyl carrier protein